MRKFELVKDEFRKHDGVDIILPQRSTKHSAGYDFYLPCDVTILPHERTKIIATDVKASMGEDEVLLLFVRSSIGIKKGLVLANGTGVIDSDFFSNEDNDGNIGISLYNTSDETVYLKKGERVMQGVFVKYLSTDNDNTYTERNGGIGSTNG